MKKLGIQVADSIKDKNKTYVISMDPSYNKYIFELIKFLRGRGILCDINFNIRNLGKEIKSAQNNGYRNVIIIGEDEYRKKSVKVKKLENYSQQEFDWETEKEKILNFLEKME